jgi:hypothetical protein
MKLVPKLYKRGGLWHCWFTWSTRKAVYHGECHGVTPAEAYANLMREFMATSPEVILA